MYAPLGYSSLFFTLVAFQDSELGILMIDNCLPAYQGHPFERMCLQNVSLMTYL